MNEAVIYAEPEKLNAQQRAFLAYVRNPDRSLPEGANERAMGIYADLVYRNIAGFIHQFFPVCTQVCEPQNWEALIRDFIAHHRCQTPYFLAIAEEFLQFLFTKPTSLAALPDYITELAHYEWVELALDVADIAQPAPAQTTADPWDSHWQLSPLAWCLAYQYPVHLIGPDNSSPAPSPSAFVVYRNAELEIKFIALTASSAQWLQTINADTTPRLALQKLLTVPLTPAVAQQTAQILQSWLELGVLIAADN
ncbi:MAG TPA: putative DNA-binding domain-containing protein [Cellvibrionaceae bacterium]